MNSKKKILAVDDSSIVRKIIKSTVEVMNFELREASDGMEALSVLERETEISLILLDWNMPGMDGFEFLKTIKCHPLFKQIPVMMITAESEKENIIKAVQAGVGNYLLKPFKSDELARKITEMLGLRGIR